MYTNHAPIAHTNFRKLLANALRNFRTKSKSSKQTSAFIFTSVKCNAKRAQNIPSSSHLLLDLLVQLPERKKVERIKKNTRSHEANAEMNFKMKICHIDDKKKSLFIQLTVFLAFFPTLCCSPLVCRKAERKSERENVYFILHSSTFTLLLFWLCIISFFWKMTSTTMTMLKRLCARTTAETKFEKRTTTESREKRPE